MEYCYSRTESLWYGSWNCHVCRKGKCAADRHSRSTGVNPSRKQRCSSPSCLWSQAQRDTFEPDNSQSLGSWLTICHQCICVKFIWDANFFFPVESKDCMNSASYEYRNMSARRGAQFVPIGKPTIRWKTFPPKTTKMLSSRKSFLNHSYTPHVSTQCNRFIPTILQNYCDMVWYCSFCTFTWHEALYSWVFGSLHAIDLHAQSLRRKDGGAMCQYLSNLLRILCNGLVKGTV